MRENFEKRNIKRGRKYSEGKKKVNFKSVANGRIQNKKIVMMWLLQGRENKKQTWKENYDYGKNAKLTWDFISKAKTFFLVGTSEKTVMKWKINVVCSYNVFDYD